MNKPEQLNIQGVAGCISLAPGSTVEYSDRLFGSAITHYYACADIGHYYTDCHRRTDDPAIKVEFLERKGLKIAGVLESFSAIERVFSQQHCFFSDVYHCWSGFVGEPEESSSEETRASQIGDPVLTPVSVVKERMKSQDIARYRAATYRAVLATLDTPNPLVIENALLKETNKTLQRTLGIQEAADVYMREARTGTVSEVFGDQVEVTYETAGDPLKQIYSRKQFMQGKLPKEGDKVEAHVIIAVVNWETDQPKETEFVSDLPNFRDKAEAGPIHL